MKLVTFEDVSKRRHVGARTPAGEIVDLTSAYALYLRDIEEKKDAQHAAERFVPPNMRKLFLEGDKAMDAARRGYEHALKRGAQTVGLNGERVIHSAKDVKVRAPIIPRKFFHTAGNFREHHEEAQKAGFSHPVMPWIVFFQNIDAIIGPDPVVYPSHLTEELDYELELAVVIKKSGKHFNEKEAVDYIGGYVIFNDITARDIQRREMESGVFSFCKGIDTFCPLGPHIVTPDEIPDPHNLAMELRVNGESRQRSHTSKMSVKIPQILAHYSAMGYSAGDVVSTGTVSGVAAFSGDPKAWYLKPGDVMECDIEKIGILRNPVVSWEEAHGGPPPKVASASS
jgi:2-keto-4-pentenoate hydratase/2-oxohepta-3-ene-1,7-dioic acid hydratase in catechol pathway